MSPRLLLSLAFFLLLWHCGWCDDCSSPEDAMDTWWVGPPIKGLAAAVIAVAVNGKTILVKVLKPPLPAPGDKPSDDPPPVYRLSLDSQDRRTELTLNGSEGLWVYASIQVTNPPPGFDAALAAESISFSADTALQLSEPQLQGARKAVYVKASSSDSPPPTRATLVASAVLAGQPVYAPLTLTLETGYELVVTCFSEYSQEA